MLRMLIEPSLATYHLCWIVDPGESLVGGHHGCQVGQRTDTIIRALCGVFLLGGEYVGHDESVEVVDGTLEEDQGSDGCKSFLFAFKHIFPSSAKNGF